MLLEYEVLPSFQPKAFNPPPRTEDEDVAKERRRVESGAAATDQVVVRDLKRVYYKKAGGKTNRFTAVDGLTFGIPHGECFGLLGVRYLFVSLALEGVCAPRRTDRHPELAPA
jgi:ABC-type glutathione transport system ATPase component